MPGKLAPTPNVKWISISSIPKHLLKNLGGKRYVKAPKLYPQHPTSTDIWISTCIIFCWGWDVALTNTQKPTEKNIHPFKMTPPKSSSFGSQKRRDSDRPRPPNPISTRWCHQETGLQLDMVNLHDSLPHQTKNAMFFSDFYPKKKQTKRLRQDMAILKMKAGTCIKSAMLIRYSMA